MDKNIVSENNENTNETMKQQQKKDFENILRNYLDSNPHLSNNGRTSELEIRFGTNNKLSRPISKINYDNVVKQLLLSGFKSENIDGIQLLRINNEYIDPRSGQTKMSNIRAEIVGADLIQEYCRTNSIQKLIDLPSTTSNKIKFTRKNNAVTKSGEMIKRVDMNDYNFRVSFQSEQDFNIQSNISRDIIHKWLDSKKTFRCLNRVRFYHPEYPVFADLSILKTSKKTNYIPIPEYTIQEANVFDGIESYEVELEIDNKRVGTGTDFNTVDKLMKVLRKSIMIVLSGLQCSKFPISYIESNSILQSYMKLIHSDDFAERKIKPKDFIGPSSFTLQIENIQPINNDSKIINIRNNYTVTEKADGERKLLYINENGKIYLIDTNMNVIFTGTKTLEKTIFNSLLDGEHIKNDKNGNFIHLYAAFDIYYVNKKTVRDFPFCPNTSINDEELKNKEKVDIKCNSGESNMKYRLPLLDCFVELIKPISIIETGNRKMPIHSTDFRIQRKNFYVSSENFSIFDACSDILSKIKEGIFEYNTDGLIFTPSALAVGGDVVGGTSGPLYKSTWQHSFKWKPPEYNTIDFLVSVKKDKTGRDEIHNILQEGRNLQGVQDVVQYKTIILRCGFNEKEHGYINPFQDILNDNLPSSGRNYEDENEYKPVPFQPTNPYDPNACFANIMLKEDGNKMFMITEENQYFEENMIVEFKYISTNEDGWKWVPLRVRYDKTSELNAGLKNYGNAYHVANNNWHSIHNPVTDSMISIGKNIPEYSLSEEVYYNRSNEETSTQSMRDFHNLFVKKNLILGVANRGDTLIDYAVGKAGDMSKWIMAKLIFRKTIYTTILMVLVLDF
jgi:hypothetical protein